VLGRRTSHEPERLPLDRPAPCGSGERRSRSLFPRAASAPHPVACCKNDPPRQRPVSHFRLFDRWSPRVAPQRITTEKMRLSNFCNRLTNRAPSGLSDSRLLRATNLAAVRLALRRLWPMTSSSSGEASLDGDAPASAWQRLPDAVMQDRGPDGQRRREPRTVLVKLRSQLLRAGFPGGGVIDHTPSSQRSLWRSLSQPSDWA